MSRRGYLTTEMGRRRHTLLVAIVQDFIATAEPVGSHHIASKYSLGVRSATVRSMMAELEIEGYLHQPHTSAGRVPADKAYRYYVDSLMPGGHLGHRERARIEYHYSERSGDLNEVMRETGRLLAELTGQTALVVSPRFDSEALRHVAFVSLRPRQVMALFVTLNGTVHSRLLDTDRDFSSSELERIGNYLNENLHHRTLPEIRAWIESCLREERARYDALIQEALVLGDAVISEYPNQVEVYVEGSSKALDQPEFRHPNRLRELVRALQDKASLLALVEHSLVSGTRGVSIGSENGDSRAADLSVVAAAYLRSAGTAGSLAVVGPVRMDYGRVIPLVDYTARALSRSLDL